MSSKILITGCVGFIGSHLCRHFLEQGDHVIGIDNLSRTGTHKNLEWVRASTHGNFTFYQEDIRNFHNILSIVEKHAPLDLVIHEAAQVAVTSSTTNPRHDFETNALGTFNLLEATRMASPDAFFQFASTNKVYGKMEGVGVIKNNGRYEYEDRPEGISEEMPLDFHSPYGCSKGCADQYVHDYHRIYGLRTAVLRQSCIYGTRQFGVEDQGWVAWFIIASILRRPITIYGDGCQIRDLLWIDDLVKAYSKVYQKAEQTAGKIYNVGGGPENTLSITELVDFLRAEDLLKGDLLQDDWRPGDQKVYVSNIQKIQSDCGWCPETSVQNGLKKLTEWASQNRALLSQMFSSGEGLGKDISPRGVGFSQPDALLNHRRAS